MRKIRRICAIAITAAISLSLLPLTARGDELSGEVAVEQEAVSEQEVLAEDSSAELDETALLEEAAGVEDSSDGEVAAADGDVPIDEDAVTGDAVIDVSDDGADPDEASQDESTADEGDAPFGWVIADDGVHYIDPETGEMLADGTYEIAGLTAPVLAAGTELVDVDETTAHSEDISWLFDSGISTGWLISESESEFRPMSSIVRQDMAAFLYRMAGSPSYEPSDEDILRFIDVDASTPHALEVWWLGSMGISMGWREADGTSTFRPMNRIVRQDMAAFLHRLSLDAQPADYSGFSPFADVDETTPHVNDILWLAANGISEGWLELDGTRTFRPMNSIVRADTAAFLHRMSDKDLVDDSAAHEYCFDADGSIVTGWVDDRFYDRTSGVRVESGWIRDEASTGYLDPSTGELLSDGLHDIWGSKFLFDENASLVTGWADTEIGRRFFGRPSGAMYANGIKKADGTSYFFNPDGSLSFGWVSHEGSKYYFDPSSGAMYTGARSIDSTTYVFDKASGKMLSNGTFISDGHAYRLGSDGRAASSLTGTGNAQLDSYIDWIIVNKCGTTGEKGLRAAYDYIRSCPYISSSHVHDTDWQSWAPGFALQFKSWGGGNCYRYASTMAYTAIALGYNAKVVPGLAYGTTDHGWCEITMPNGSLRVIDCSMGSAHAYPNINWFLVSYHSARIAYYSMGGVLYDDY